MSVTEKIMDHIKHMDSRDLHTSINMLAEEKGFLENIFNSISEGIMVVDKHLKIKYRNRAATRMLGIPDDVSRLSAATFLKGADWKALLSEKGRSSRHEMEILYPERRIIRFYVVPLEKAEVVSVILTDITEDYAKALSKAERERGQLISMLAAGVAHEIGNPLNSLYLNLQLLQRMFRNPDPDLKEASESIEAAKKEVERLDAILNQFLKALRPAKLYFKPSDIKEILLESLKFMRHEIENRSVSVQCLWGDSLPLVQADEAQLKQAFYNIIKNAVQSMPHGGKLNICCMNGEEDNVIIEFTDTGKGISPENMPHLGDAFYTTKAGGNGLGLMVVERIIRQHGARFSIESAEGKGTCFRIVFPPLKSRMRILPPGSSPAAELPPASENIAKGKEKA